MSAIRMDISLAEQELDKAPAAGEAANDALRPQSGSEAAASS